jgi:hypothetical protein
MPCPKEEGHSKPLSDLKGCDTRWERVQGLAASSKLAERWEKPKRGAGQVSNPLLKPPQHCNPPDNLRQTPLKPREKRGTSGWRGKMPGCNAPHDGRMIESDIAAL